jgi:hypothetical protein
MGIKRGKLAPCFKLGLSPPSVFLVTTGRFCQQVELFARFFDPSEFFGVSPGITGALFEEHGR